MQKFRAQRQQYNLVLCSMLGKLELFVGRGADAEKRCRIGTGKVLALLRLSCLSARNSGIRTIWPLIRRRRAYIYIEGLDFSVSGLPDTPV